MTVCTPSTTPSSPYAICGPLLRSCTTQRWALVDMSTLWVVDGLRRGPTDAEMTVSDLARHMGVAHSTANRLVAGRGGRYGSPGHQCHRSSAGRGALTDKGRELAREPA